MSTGCQVGNITKTERCKELEVQWIINDIFSYTAEHMWYYSPDFSVSGCEWYLEIFSSGESCKDTVGWISLYLNRGGDYSSSKSVDGTLGVKKADGEVEVKANFSWIVDGIDWAWGKHDFLKWSELMRRKSELAPSDALTVTCTLRVNEHFDSVARLDTLSENFKDMFISARNCDVIVEVKHTQFSVHKFILEARSPVFAAMFEVDMKEKQTGVINIADCEPEAFEDFLLYLYCGKLEYLSSNVFELYKIADKYDVAELKNACVRTIACNITVENVCDAVILAHRFNEFDLKTKTQRFFNANFGEIVLTSKWLLLLKENYRVANDLLIKMAPRIKLRE